MGAYLVLKMSLSSNSRPTTKSSITAPRWAILFTKSVKVISPRTLGPTIRPTSISPMTAD